MTHTQGGFKINSLKLVPQEFQFLLSWSYENFFNPSSNDEFICKGCSSRVKRWEREGHFDEHNKNKEMLIEASRVAANIARESGSGETRVDVCVNCGNSFEQERKRGRPRKVCYDCSPPA